MVLTVLVKAEQFDLLKVGGDDGGEDQWHGGKHGCHYRDCSEKNTGFYSSGEQSFSSGLDSD